MIKGNLQIESKSISFVLESVVIQGCHAAGARARDGLPINVVLHIARGKNTLNTRHGGQALQAASSDDIAVFHL